MIRLSTETHQYNQAANLPAHLKQFVVEQRHEFYSARDKALWKFLFRSVSQNLKFLHPSHLSGVMTLGISESEIPSITKIGKRLEKFGWTALPITGLLPKSVFYEFLSMRIFPVSVDMRTPSELSYSHEPDVFHDSYGHLAMITDHHYREYLEKLARVALYLQSEETEEEYLRDLWKRELTHRLAKGSSESDVDLAKKMIESFELGPETTLQKEVSRLAWWTIEYGVLRDSDQVPKIFGAALLSSLDETKAFIKGELPIQHFGMESLCSEYDPADKVTTLFEIGKMEKLLSFLDQYCQHNGIEVPVQSTRGEKSTFGFETRDQINSAKQDSGPLLDLYEEAARLQDLGRLPWSNISDLRILAEGVSIQAPEDWLLQLETLELANLNNDESLQDKLTESLLRIARSHPSISDNVRKGISLYSTRRKQTGANLRQSNINTSLVKEIVELC